MLEDFFREAKAHYDGRRQGGNRLRERLVWFWTNHFCVNAKYTVQAGAYERERSARMCSQIRRPPCWRRKPSAMLFYLNNSSSMGPNSIAGITAIVG